MFQDPEVSFTEDSEILDSVVFGFQEIKVFCNLGLRVSELKGL
jgi:hypothetical protein